MTQRPVEQRRGSGGPYENRYGYCRVIRMGPLAMTAGCTSIRDGVVKHVGDAGGQTRTALLTALSALADVGVAPEDVVAVRMSIVAAADADAVGLAHGKVLGHIRPAATMVIVAGLIDREMLVEVELTAWSQPPGEGSGSPEC